MTDADSRLTVFRHTCVTNTRDQNNFRVTGLQVVRATP